MPFRISMIEYVGPSVGDPTQKPGAGASLGPGGRGFFPSVDFRLSCQKSFLLPTLRGRELWEKIRVYRKPRTLKARFFLRERVRSSSRGDDRALTYLHGVRCLRKNDCGVGIPSRRDISRFRPRSPGADDDECDSGSKSS